MKIVSVKCVFFTLMIFAICATFFCGVVLISASTDPGVTIDLSWSHGDKTFEIDEQTIKVFLSVNNLVTTSETVQNSESTFSSLYSSNSCTSEFCESCDTSMKVVISFVTIAFICSFPSIYTNCLRATVFGNTHQNYMTGLVFSVVTIICSVFAIITFSLGCRLKVETDPNNSMIQWSYGPSFVLMVSVIILKVIDLIINTLIPLSNGRLVVIKPSQRYLAGRGVAEIDFDPISPGGRYISEQYNREEESEMLHFKVYRWWDSWCISRY